MNWRVLFRRQVCAFALLSAAVCGASSNVVVSGTGLPVSRLFFGINAHRLDAGTPWPSAEVGSLRTWDAKVRWVDLQPSQDKWNFSRLDHLVNNANLRKIDVLIPLGMPPSWASSRPQELSAYGLGEAAPPAHMADWEAYIRVVATRYKGKVSAYEIWNEPNLPKFFSGSPEDAVRLTCAAQRVINQIDPQAKIVSPAALGDYGVVWLDKFLAAGGGACFDIVGYHFYNKHKDPETHIKIFEDIKLLSTKYKISEKPIWNTEAGWLIESIQQKMNPQIAGFDVQARVLSRREAASVVARTLILHAAMGTSRFYWYALDNDAMGLLERDGVAKPAWKSYLQTAQLLTGRVVKVCSSKDAAWSCEISDGVNVVAHVRWQIGPALQASPTPTNIASSEILGFGPIKTSEAAAAITDGDVVVYRLK